MSDLDIFGPIVVDTEPGIAMETTLQTWLPTYLSLLSRALTASGVDLGGPLPPPRSYVQSADATHFPEEAPPAIVIAVPGTLETHRQGGLYRATWDVRVVAWVTSKDRDTTEALAKYYATAVRTLIANKPSLSNFSEGAIWRGTRYGLKVGPRDERTIGSCELRFEVDVLNVAQEFGGPTEPITTVPASWPTVTQAGVSLTPRPIS